MKILENLIVSYTLIILNIFINICLDEAILNVKQNASLVYREIESRGIKNV
jgi:hypothetical protein